MKDSGYWKREPAQQRKKKYQRVEGPPLEGGPEKTEWDLND